MELMKSITVPRTTYTDQGVIVLPAGKSLKIETTPHGAEVLNAETPAGKVWTVTISVRAIETDAA